MSKNQTQIEEKINEIKRELDGLGIIRPGSISQQRRKRGGTYHQLSYSHKGKSHTEYVRPEHVEQLSKEIADYKKMKELVALWVELSIEASRKRREQNM